MHVPDGFMDSPTCVVAGATALLGVTHAVRALRAERPDDDRVPMAALVATFVFAAQMINVQVAGGTSGHLIGAAVAAVLVGPATAVICLTGVLAVQAVFFADGGLGAIGVNVTLMALITTMVGWLVFRAVLAMLPKVRAAVPVAAAAGALISVPASAVAFAAIYAIGGAAPVGVIDLLVSMAGWHTLIGVGEAVVTGVVVSVVIAVRPDLVFGVRRLRAVPESADA